MDETRTCPSCLGLCFVQFHLQPVPPPLTGGLLILSMAFSQETLIDHECDPDQILRYETSPILDSSSACKSRDRKSSLTQSG